MTSNPGGFFIQVSQNKDRLMIFQMAQIMRFFKNYTSTVIISVTIRVYKQNRFYSYYLPYNTNLKNLKTVSSKTNTLTMWQAACRLAVFAVLKHSRQTGNI